MTSITLPNQTKHTATQAQAKTQVVLCFSGGKDSCLALQQLRKDPSVEVVGLLTTIGMPYDRVSHHGVRRRLLMQQAEAIGLPLTVIELESSLADCTAMEAYESRMETVIQLFQQQGVQAMAFGDLFLEDLRAYREKRNQSAGMKSLFPLWGSNTRELAERFIDDGFKAVLTCVDTHKMDRSFAGRTFDHDLLNDLAKLPEAGVTEVGLPGAGGVDPCGENGEFHSFVWDGPVFNQPVGWTLGERLDDGNRSFIDLIPVDKSDSAPNREQTNAD